MESVSLISSRNFADVFKTPGKLRGKTPRTARKQNPPAPRQPLSDIFGSNTRTAPPSTQKNSFLDKISHFQITDDQENQQHRPRSRSKSPQRIGKPGNIDSGYHGMTEDEMEVDARTESATQSSEESISQTVPLGTEQVQGKRVLNDTTDAGGASDESFQSAKEDLTSRNASRAQVREHQSSCHGTIGENREMPDAPPEVVQDISKEDMVVPQSEAEAADHDMDNIDSPQTPSDTSSPEKPLQRKSSFNFTSLPAREPLTAKRSIGVRESQYDAQAGQTSALALSIGAEKNLKLSQNNEDSNSQSQQRSVDVKLQNKTSTQLLHERITMLGKSKKSIPLTNGSAQAVYPQLPTVDMEDTSVSNPQSNNVAASEDDDDDWIAPSKLPAMKPKSAQQGDNSTLLSRPAMHQKSISTTDISSPRPTSSAIDRLQKAASVSAFNVTHTGDAVLSTTPAGSPIHKRTDGPLSASKNRLWSAIRSAKNIFASSASASAAAKLEAHSNSPALHRSPERDVSGESKLAAVYNMPGAMYSNMDVAQSPSREGPTKTGKPAEIDRKREKELKAQQKMTDELEKAREKERRTAAKQQEQQVRSEQAATVKREKEIKKTVAQDERPASAENGRSQEEKSGQKGILPAGKLRAPGRLMRPTKHEQSAARPAPVSIRVASQSQRLGQGALALNKSQHEATAPPPPPKSSLRTTSAQGNTGGSAAPNSARVKALEAAARKKEADERAMQKKMDQKRELERKRAAKAEEERQAEEERKAAEQQRLLEAKLALQRKAEQQATEAKQRDQQRYEYQRQQEEIQRAKAAHELAEVIKRERAQQIPPTRSDIGGTLRQLTKSVLGDHSSRPPIQVNPVKPPKRVFSQDEDGPQLAPPRPGLARGPPSYQQNDAKRRRTNEIDEEELDPQHSVMAPPKRPSNMRKVGTGPQHHDCTLADRFIQESTLNKFPHGYTNAPASTTSHHASNMFKATVTAQHQMHHSSKAMPNHPSQTVQMSNARIPFAENVNPPAQHHGYHPPYPGHENAQPNATNKFKTPARPAQAPRPPPKSARSSPMYPNGDAIQLPEIQTDSEDEDSEDEAGGGGFRAPSWVESPALKDLLTQQQLLDPEKVFGPIPELRMEEVFKNGKNPERLKRFRERGSSAMWVESGDAVTSAEKRRDMEGRERVVREGGWRFEPYH
nr:inner centromere protein-related protein pic1 [Quercus suber]